MKGFIPAVLLLLALPGVAWGDAQGSRPGASPEDGSLFRTDETEAISVCTPAATQLCLHRRFRVEVAWDFKGTSRPARVVPGAAANSGAFWFLAPDDWQVMVRVENGCASNQRYGVSIAGTSTDHYVVKVTDTATGKVRRYENPAGRAAAATIDSNAFATCP